MDNFQAVIDRYRCESVCEHRRCQLWGDHLGAGLDHAAAWTASRAHTAGHPHGRSARQHWTRWDASGMVTEQEPHSQQLPWACIGVA